MEALSEEIGATFLSSLKGGSDLDEYEGSLAMTLLRSTDQKVVAAAKRIFLSAISNESPKSTKRLENMNETVEAIDDCGEVTEMSIQAEHASATDTGQSRNAKPKSTPTGFSSHGVARTKSSKSADSRKKQTSERLQRG